MAISNFVSAGIALHNKGKMDVSLALICSAIDATSKKMFRNDSNNCRIKKFVKLNMSIITKYGFPGLIATDIKIKCIDIPYNLKPDRDGYVGIEDIIYHVIRCGLIHECEIDNLVEFTDTTIIGDFIGKFKIPKQLFWGLALSVIFSHVNVDEPIYDEVLININGMGYNLQELWGKELEKNYIYKQFT